MKSITNTLIILLVAITTAVAQPVSATVDLSGARGTGSAGVGLNIGQSFGELQLGLVYHNNDLVEEAAAVRVGVQKQIYSLAGLPIISGIEALGLFGQARPDDPLRLQAGFQFNNGVRLSLANAHLDLLTGFQHLIRHDPASGWVPLTVRLHL